MEMYSIIDEKRNDAIGIYTSKLYEALIEEKPNTNLILANNASETNKFAKKYHELKSIFTLKCEFQSSNNLIFADPKKLYSISSIFSNACCMIIVHHIDKYAPVHFFRSNKIMRIFIENFDIIVAISNSTKAALVKLGIDDKKIHVIYNGIDHRLFYRREANPSPNTPYILFVGTELPRKNFPTVIECFRRLLIKHPNLKLIKIGKPGSQSNRLKNINLIKQNNLNNHVVFLDYVDSDLLSEYYSHAELLIFPSLLEGFGFPIIEAMACGCPVVTSNLAPMNELTAYKDLLADPRNPDDIVKKCELILSKKLDPKALINSGLQKAKLFNWQNTAKSMLSLFEDFR